MSLERLLQDMERLEQRRLHGPTLAQLMEEVGTRIDSLEKSLKCREEQLLDALDEVKALRGQVQERDEMISDLQQMVSRAVEAAE